MSRVAHPQRRGQRERADPPTGPAPAAAEDGERITLEEAVLRAQQAHRHGQLDL
ncbi:MAG: hypothetical protein JSR40_08290, partial [Proteobacteria bacterium]|nr:hypothetical protein [Pseudomonadota bacterium]